VRFEPSRLSVSSSAFIAQKPNEFELSIQELGEQLVMCESALRAYDEKHECETLCVDGRIYDAAQHIANTMTGNSRREVIDLLEGELVHLVLE
jgi:hypothetical protein